MEVDAAGRRITIDPAAGATATFGFDALGRTATRSLCGGGSESYRFNGSSETVTAVAGGTTTAGLLDAAGAMCQTGDVFASMRRQEPIRRVGATSTWPARVDTPSRGSVDCPHPVSTLKA